MRRRMIDPAFWTDSKLIACTRDARLLYIGLWNYGDDEGFFIDDLPAIKRALFPDQDFNIEIYFAELLPFLVEFTYTNNGSQKRAYQIRAFQDWQTINRPTKSKIAPLCTKFTESSLNTHGVLTEPSLSTHAQVKLREVNIKKDPDKRPLEDSQKKFSETNPEKTLNKSQKTAPEPLSDLLEQSIRELRRNPHPRS